MLDWIFIHKLEGIFYSLGYFTGACRDDLFEIPRDQRSCAYSKISIDIDYRRIFLPLSVLQQGLESGFCSKLTNPI